MTTKHVRKTEDLLPKVLVAGQPSDCVPRIIICDSMEKKQKRNSTKNASMQFRISNKPQPSCPPTMRCPPAPPCPPPPMCPPPPTCPPPLVCPPPIKSSSRKHSECCPPPPPPRQPSNFDESSACSKLMLRMQSLQDEMSALSRQNEKMQQQLTGPNGIQKCRVKPSFPCSRAATFPKSFENRVQEYSKHTNTLEMQVETMEQSVRCLNQQFKEAEKRNKEMENARIHAQKMTETLECQKLEREPKLKCREYCRGNCAKQTEKCSCSKPDYKCG